MGVMKQCFPVVCISMMFWVLLCPISEAQYSRRSKVMRGFGPQPGAVDPNLSYIPQLHEMVSLNDKDSVPGSVGSMTSNIPPTREMHSPSAEASGPKAFDIKPITEPQDYPTHYLGPNSKTDPGTIDIKPNTKQETPITYHLGPLYGVTPSAGVDTPQHDINVTTDVELNSPCRNSYECRSGILNSQCDIERRVCECLPYHITYNSTMCLPSSVLSGVTPSTLVDTPQHYINITTDVELNSPCRNSYDCRPRIVNSQCNIERRVCECLPYYIIYNSTMCKPAPLLGFSCTTDQQCNVKVEHSQCIDGICGCKPRYFPMGFDKCSAAVEIGDLCQSDKQCRHHDIYSYCNYHMNPIYGYCQCPPGYIVNEFGLNCLPHLGYHCVNHVDCEALTPGSYCKIDDKVHHAHCGCLPGMEPTVDNSHCIFDRSAMFVNTTKFEDLAVISLGQECQVHAECQKRDPHSHCLNGICECVQPDLECNATNTGCHPGTFQCRNGYCIPWYFVCDGKKNCADGSDEDCEQHRIASDKDAYRCRNGQCKPSHSFCNAIRECVDGSGESINFVEHGFNCTTIAKPYLQWNNERCIGSTIDCSGADFCRDNNDDQKCEVCYCKKPLK